MVGHTGVFDAAVKVDNPLTRKRYLFSLRPRWRARGPSSRPGVMEQNLDRLTVIMAVVFAVCVVLCMFFFPQGIVGY